MSSIFTIGYGNRKHDDFRDLLLHYRIEVVCDVRSTPYSARYEQFNREVLQKSLRDSGMKYLFLGEFLGARPSDPDLYVEGRASYKAMERSSTFQRGIERIETGANLYRIAVMCAEKEPLDCHRAILVSRVLVREGLTVHHIGPDGKLESHDKLERRMMEKYGFIQASLFESSVDSTILTEAYERRGAELAYNIDAAYRARASS